jgi:hypothetical protein
MFRSVTRALSHLHPRRLTSQFWVPILLAGTATALVYLVLLEEVRLAVTVTVVFLLVGTAMINIRLSILAVVGYLIVLGDLRRLLVPIAGWTGSDPLLLIGPVFVIILCLFALASRSIKFDTPLAKWGLALMVIMALQTMNPKQGGLAVGIAGILFVMVPLLWFWVGRTFATKQMMEMLLFKVVAPLSVVAALFGLYQVFYGYLPYQMAWYEVAGYLGIGSPETGLVPISFFASGTEHGNFIVIGAVILFCIGIRTNNALLLVLPLMLVSLFLTGSRGPVVRMLGMLVGLWAILSPSIKSWIPRGALALVVVTAGLVWSLNTATQSGVGPSNVQFALNRQAAELTQQGREDEHSSALVHLTLLTHGYVSGITNPLGYGLGATSKAAEKFSRTGKPVYGTETDVGDSFMTLGLPGGLIYHYMIFLIIVSGFRYWIRTRSALALAILGVLGATFLMWLGGGQYAVSPIVWICAGALDRFNNIESRPST